MTRSRGADARRVPAREGRCETREKASRFLAFAFPVACETEASQAIARLKKEFHDATHVAFAWSLGSGDAASKRSSDAGEPSGTAGKPIASAIESAGVTDVLLAVVRYFGGTKLGTGGLARAYREAAALALAAAGVETRHEIGRIVVRCPYGRVGALKRLIHPPEVTLSEETYGETPALRLTVFRDSLPALLAALEEARFAYDVEEVSP